jgi:hypothetical protein
MRPSELTESLQWDYLCFKGFSLWRLVVSQGDGFLRVLLEPKEKRGLTVWIATCLETGYVASGKTADRARDEMLAVLREEYTYAKKHNNLRALFRSAAIPQSLLDRWKDAIRVTPPQTVLLFPKGVQPVELATISRAA